MKTRPFCRPVLHHGRHSVNKIVAVIAMWALVGNLSSCDQAATDAKPGIKGQSTTSTDPPAEESVHHGHGHSHGHEHGHGHDHAAEHGIPRHKPADFALCVKAISGTGHGLLHHADDQQAAAFRDFLRWLPELAAETDLRKPDWDEVALIAREFEQWFPLGGNPVSHRDFDQLVGRLRKLVKQSQALAH